MTNQMTCDEFADSLSDYLESSAGASMRSAIEAHALGCRDCGSLLADVRKLSLDAANLPELTPSRDLWTGIAARIETPVVELKQSAATKRWNAGTQRRTNRVWMGLAAAGLVAVTATITHQLTQRSAVTGAPSSLERTAATAARVDRDTTAPAATAMPSASQQLAANAPASPARHSDVSVPGGNTRASTTRLASSSTPAAEQTAEQTYDREIATLRLVLKRRRSDLDSATVAVVERNLKVIDDAIAQCKKALQKDPASRFLIESLNDALDTKLQLLRTAAMLPSRT